MELDLRANWRKFPYENKIPQIHNFNVSSPAVIDDSVPGDMPLQLIFLNVFQFSVYSQKMIFSVFIFISSLIKFLFLNLRYLCLWRRQGNKVEKTKAQRFTVFTDKKLSHRSHRFNINNRQSVSHSPL